MIEKPIIKNSKSTSENKIYHKLWNGTTNIYPIDSIIKNKIIPYAYCHHIERLMVLGNFMKLCMINNDLIYRMFMEWTIDAYEWLSKNIYYYRKFNYYIKINLYSNYI
jgi:deoxyribodipyrimidine photolyase-related protein